MAELFESYEEEFRGVAASAQKLLSDARTYESNPERRRQLLRQAEPQVQQLEGLVSTRGAYGRLWCARVDPSHRS